MSETRLTPERRAGLDRLCETATPGPWGAENRHSDFGPCYNTVRTPKGLLCDDYGIDLLVDAEFIAAARTALPEALAEVDRLTARWEVLKAWMEQCLALTTERNSREAAEAVQAEMTRLEQEP